MPAQPDYESEDGKREVAKTKAQACSESPCVGWHLKDGSYKHTHF